jgi:thymidylate synthase (FAD)
MYNTKRPISEGAEKIIGKYFPVLDHGFVCLKDYCGTDNCIETAARVSYSGGGTRAVSKTNGLLRYLKRHLHTTPFEMIELKFHCCMPTFIARQWIRHRTANVNEMSGRYSLLPMMFYTPDQSRLQTQSKDNKQGSSGNAISDELFSEYTDKMNKLRDDSVELYTWLNQNEVARELARIDLPLSTYTQWYWKIDLHNLFHFLKLRVDSHAQWEIQEYGRVMAGMVKEIAPLAYEAWLDYDVCGTRMSAGELALLQDLIKIDDDSVYTNGDRFSNLKDVHGLSDREIVEFKEKLTPKPRPDFTLDLSKAKDGTFFEDKMRTAISNE